MKIGQVTTNFKPIRGGAEVYLAELNKVLERTGHTIHVYQPDTGDRSPEVVPVEIGFKGFPNSIRFDLSLFKFFGKLRKEDILIIHYPEHWWPLFWHPRTVVLTHGINWEFNSRKRRFVRRVMAWLAYHFAWRFVANDTNFLRGVGEKIEPRQKMFERVGRSQYFIPNCIDADQFKKTDIPKDLVGQKLIVVPRNLTYPRGVDMAIRAMTYLLKKDPGFKLLIVGDALPTPDSQQFKAELLALTDQLKLKDKVIFYGNHPHAEMPGIYSAGFITVIPTRGSEGTSLSALESMAVGTPVVTTAVAGLRDLPSYQCEPNPESIAEGILTVAKAREKFAAQQQKAVRETYNVSNWSKAWLKVIGS